MLPFFIYAWKKNIYLYYEAQKLQKIGHNKTILNFLGLIKFVDRFLMLLTKYLLIKDNVSIRKLHIIRKESDNENFLIFY